MDISLWGEKTLPTNIRILTAFPNVSEKEINKINSKSGIFVITQNQRRELSVLSKGKIHVYFGA